MIYADQIAFGSQMGTCRGRIKDTLWSLCPLTPGRFLDAKDIYTRTKKDMICASPVRDDFSVLA